MSSAPADVSVNDVEWFPLVVFILVHTARTISHDHTEPARQVIIAVIVLVIFEPEVRGACRRRRQRQRRRRSAALRSAYGEHNSVAVALQTLV
jgi:hypothetical protein